ncbi:hypothetical protein B0H11DRAFT_2225226 [Mycena galericulata]|nr:hypothetical protein B0H11DRAFT_2225226 [Mycena galericulata]
MTDHGNKHAPVLLPTPNSASSNSSSSSPSPRPSQPLLGVLLRSLASFTSSSSSPLAHSTSNSFHSHSSSIRAQGSASATPISWFSVLLAALHSSRASRRVPAPCTQSSMFRYRLPPTLPILLLPTDANRGIESQTRRLESTLRLLRKDNKEAIQAVETYVEGALAPLEDGMRRMERRVAKLRASEKVKEDRRARTAVVVFRADFRICLLRVHVRALLAGGEGFGGKRCCVCGSDEQVVEVIPEEGVLPPTSSSRTLPPIPPHDTEYESCEKFGFSNGDSGTTVMRSARAGSPLNCVMDGFCAASGG